MVWHEKIVTKGGLVTLKIDRKLVMDFSCGGLW